ncbi:MAG: (Fe-S)-binding protein, partial [Deltaproteobacteria bacterium]|nr:(Fe-S)-binding protein [Deltaproteobacteria bacterium]
IRAAGRAPEPFLALAEAVAERGNVSPFDNASRADWLDEVEEDGAATDPASAVGYFVGCVASFYPMVTDIPVSFAGLAARMGRPVAVLGPRERCCGFPLIGAGMGDRAAQVIRHNLEAVRESGARTLVTGCPSCLHTWTHAYPEAAGGPLGFEVMHLTAYLLRCMDEGALDPAEAEPLDAVVTYHDPCDLGRNLGEYDAPREVLRRLPGVRLVEMAHTRELALCCGGGGNLQSIDPDLTRALAARRVREALDTGASVLVTACQQCVQVLAEAARRTRAPLRVVDIVQLVGEAFED